MITIQRPSLSRFTTLGGIQLEDTAKINVAIDGPAGAGKSTVAKKVASALGYIYVDTGAMYRAITWATMRQGIELRDQDRIGHLAAQSNIELIPVATGQQVILNGEDITEEIRHPEVSRLVSQVAAIHAVREVLVDLQQTMARDKGVVMDGRDIGTKVIPGAEVKVFLTASVEERAKRRFEELRAKGSTIAYEQLIQDIAERDRMDQERETSPLVEAPDAIHLDSTGLTIDQVVSRIITICRDVLDKGEAYG